MPTQVHDTVFVIDKNKHLQNVMMWKYCLVLFNHFHQISAKMFTPIEKR